jgi:histone H3/H4
MSSKHSPADSDSELNEREDEEKTTKLQLPLARVRKIIKSDPDVKKISNDASILIAHSTELFIHFILREGYQITTDDGRKTLQYKDLAMSVQENEVLDFLLDVIPQRQTKFEIDKRHHQNKLQAKNAAAKKQPTTTASSTPTGPSDPSSDSVPSTSSTSAEHNGAESSKEKGKDAMEEVE